MSATYAERHEELLAIAKSNGFNPNDHQLNEWLKQRLEAGKNLSSVLIRTMLAITGDNENDLILLGEGSVVVSPATMRPEKQQLQLSWMNTPTNQLIISVKEHPLTEEPKDV